MSEQTEHGGFLIGVNLEKDRVTAMVVSESGEVTAKTSCAYDLPKSSLPKGREEQDPEIWWNASCYAIGHVVSQLRNKNISPKQLLGISVASLPGSIAVIDRGNNTLMPAIMADDNRALEQAVRLSMIGNEHCKKVGGTFKADHALAKIVWIKENFPDIYENAIFVHQSDYVLGLLKGGINVTDASVARLTGYDPIENCWPDWLDYDMHLSIRERLPRLGTLGEKVGVVTSAAAKATGLPDGLPVVLGGSSPMAEFIASGAKQAGDFFTKFDESLQISGISTKMFHYPHGIVKINRLPKNEWFFSTATNTGTEWIYVWFNEQLAQEYINQVESLLPSRYIAYPNVRKGEIFPFCSNSAEGFISPATDNRPAQFASCLQGTALVERLAYQFLDKSGENNNIGQIYTFGPWCKSDIWMQCRADVTERIVHRLASSHDPAFGAAMIAAMGIISPSLLQVSESMVHIDRSFYPNPEKMSLYKEYYALFQKTMQEQGYIV